MCYQNLNVTNPNAPENTCVFSIFAAPDTYTNLRISLGRYIGAITDLHSQTWRFLCEGYEFLCRIYGLSGASGTV